MAFDLLRFGVKVVGVRLQVLLGYCVALSVALSVACAGSSQHPVEADRGRRVVDSPPRECSYQERGRAICAQLKTAALLGEGGTALPATVTRCSMGELDADLTWTLQGSDQRLRSLVRFTRESEAGPLTAGDVEPVLFEWPCAGGACITDARQVRVPVVEQCEPASKELLTTLNVPALTRSSCTGVTRLTGGGESDWCSETLAPDEWVYHWSSRVGASTLERFKIVLQAESGKFVSARGISVLSAPDAIAWQERLAPIWQMTAHAGESCPDGRLELVRAVQANRWKVVERRCKPIVSEQTFEAFLR